MDRFGQLANGYRLNIVNLSQQRLICLKIILQPPTHIWNNDTDLLRHKSVQIAHNHTHYATTSTSMYFAQLRTHAELDGMSESFECLLFNGSQHRCSEIAVEWMFTHNGIYFWKWPVIKYTISMNLIRVFQQHSKHIFDFWVEIEKKKDQSK